LRTAGVAEKDETVNSKTITPLSVLLPTLVGKFFQQVVYFLIFLL